MKLLVIVVAAAGRQLWLTAALTATAEPLPAIALGKFALRYDVYVNGVKSAVAVPEAKSSYFRPRWFALPGGVLAAGSPVVLAIRVNDPVGPLGFLRALPDQGPYLLGPRREVQPTTEKAWLEHRQAVIPTMQAAGLQLVFGALTFLFWFTGVRQREFLWLSAFLLGSGLFNLLQVSTLYQDVDRRWSLLLLMANYGCLGSALASVFRRNGWLAWGLAGVAMILIGFDLLVGSPVFGFVLYLPLYPVAVWAAQAVWRETELRRVAVPVLLYVGFVLNTLAQAVYPDWPIPTTAMAGPFQIYLTTWTSAAFGLAVGLLMIQNAAGERREKARLATEMEAARSVQQFLIPAATGVPAIGAVYLPAAEVGGDFWHLLDGRLLVAGDVSGKGLKAAMVVSLITGMLDRRHGDSPAAVLAELNGALHARLNGGFVTCCVVRLDGPGRVTVASAGHPAPYADGAEVDLAAGLPLGVVAEAEYAERAVVFERQLTLVSDGVIEAESAARELFGFERTRALSGEAAAAIAEAARAWGQNDDITVVTVRRSNA